MFAASVRGIRASLPVTPPKTFFTVVWCSFPITPDFQVHGMKEFSVATIASNGAPGGAAGALKVKKGDSPCLEQRQPDTGRSTP